MSESANAADITILLHKWQQGSQDAADRLFPLVYQELHALASRHLNREWRHDRLQTTVVVSEAYVRLFNQHDVDWQNRGHFFALAAQLMRRILVDHARRQLRSKRGSGDAPVELTERIAGSDTAITAEEAIDLDRALQKLEKLDPDQGRIVELRFFAGLNVDDTAAALGISPATVKREWAFAKAWLFRELSSGRPPEPLDADLA